VKRVFAAVLTAVTLAACSDSSPVGPATSSESDASLTVSRDGRTAYVLNANDAGFGSLRAAVDLANGSPSISGIDFRARLAPIALRSTVVFSGPQSLSLNGNRASIDAASTGDDALRFTGGGDLRISSLTISHAAQEGIDVEVPATATGTVNVTLLGVTITDNKGHGVLVNDQVDQSAPDGVQPPSAGSDASVAVTVIGSQFQRNGYSVSDRDGLRVNEGGLGDLTFNMTLSKSENNAADGVELDERGLGDVKFNVVGSTFRENGNFDPEDLDDGFDIDEYNDGSIIGKVAFSSAIDNFEEGFDFNENNTGDFRVDMSFVEASGNREEGIDFEEDDDDATFGSIGGGDLVTTLIAIKANRNGVDDGDAGVKIREKLLGNLDATINGVEASDNFRSGISVREDGTGNLVSAITKATTLGNAGHGIDHDENSAGDLTATVASSTSSGNTLFGVRADQQLASGAGVGTLQLTTVTLTGNVGGTTTGANVTVTILP
jgi:hypothetical protein